MAEKLVIQIAGDVSDYENKLKIASKSTSGLSDSLKTVAKGAAIAFTGLGSAATFAVNEARKIETVTTQFAVLTGSAESAAKIVKDLTEFSAKTPFQFEGIATSAQQLLAFGFSAEQIPDKLQQIGDVSSAIGKPIEEVSFIFGQVAAAGKLTGERLLQFQERAIPIGPAIAKTLGVAESAVKDLVSKGAVDFKTFEAAFSSLSQKGGFAFEGMIKQSKDMDGVISTLKDEVALFAADLGKELLPIIKELAIKFSEFIGRLRDSPEVMEGFLDVLQGTLKIALYLKTAIQDLGGVIGVGLATAMEAASAAIDLKFSQATEIISGGVQEVGQLLKENHKQLNDDLASIDSSFAAGRTERQKEELDSLKAHLDEKKAIETEARTTKNEEELAAEEENRLAKLEREAAYAEEEKNIKKSAILDVEEAKRANEIEDLKKTTQANNQRLKEEQRYGETRAKLMAFFRSKEYEGTQMLMDNLVTLGQSGNKDLVKVAQAAAVTKAIMNTAEGVTKALTYGPILGPILAATQAAAGFVQIQTIKSQKMAKGGMVSGGTSFVDSVPIMAQAGELVTPRSNFEEVIGSVRALREANNVTGGGVVGQQTIVIGFDGDQASTVLTARQIEQRSLGTSLEG